jgi:hypothetical protein
METRTPMTDQVLPVRKDSTAKSIEVFEVNASERGLFAEKNSGTESLRICDSWLTP